MRDIETRELSRDLSVTAAERVVSVFVHRRAEIDGVAGHPKIVWKAREHRTVDVFLNALEHFFVALVPAIDNHARAIDLDTETLEREQPTFERPQRRNVRFGHDQ